MTHPRLAALLLLLLASPAVATPVTWERYAQNPVLSPGSTFDSLSIHRPVVLHTGSEYRMYYHGTDGWGTETGLATSADGMSFTRYSNTPVIPAGASYDTYAVNTNAVSYSHGQYEAWYRATPSSGGTEYIAHATSPDGISWSKTGAILTSPFLSGTPSKGNFSVLRDADTYHMWFLGHDNLIYHGFSPDGVGDWVFDQQHVFGWGAAGAWDSTQVALGNVIRTGDQYALFYAGWDGSTWGLGYALSADGLSWTRPEDGYIAGVGAAGAWDANAVVSPHGIETPSGYLLYYEGDAVDGRWLPEIGVIVGTGHIDPVPEPTTLALLACSGASFALTRRRRP